MAASKKKGGGWGQQVAQVISLIGLGGGAYWALTKTFGGWTCPAALPWISLAAIVAGEVVGQMTGQKGKTSATAKARKAIAAAGFLVFWLGFEATRAVAGYWIAGGQLPGWVLLAGITATAIGLAGLLLGEGPYALPVELTTRLMSQLGTAAAIAGGAVAAFMYLFFLVVLPAIKENAADHTTEVVWPVVWGGLYVAIGGILWMLIASALTRKIRAGPQHHHGHH